MSAFDHSSQSSPLSGFQRFLLGCLYWPVVLVVCLGAFVSRFDDGTLTLTFWFGLVFIIGGYVAFYIWRFLLLGKLRAFLAGGLLATPYAIVVLVLGAILFGFEFEEINDSEVDESHLTYGIASVAPGADGRSGFEICIEELHRVPSVGESMRNEAFSSLRGVASPDLAEDAVQDLMIKVCERFEAGKVELLRPYFFKSVRYKRSDLRKVQNRWQYCAIEDRHRPPHRDNPELREELHLVQAAMCRLDERQAYAIRRKADGDSHAEIARQLGTSESQSRRLVSDGRAELRRLVEQMRRP